MKKSIFFILIILLSSFVSANFWEDHQYMNEDALDDPILDGNYFVQLIRDGREHIFHGCNAGTDATVIWYISAKTRKSYQQSHVKKAYEDCWVFAGSDPNLQVCCLGVGAHISQDGFSSHGYKGTKGFTPDCINNYWGSNLLMHAGCENAMTQQLLNGLPTFERERLILNAGNAYDIFENQAVFEGEFRNEYAELLAKSFGFTTDEQRGAFFSAIETVGFYVKTGQGSGYNNMWKLEFGDIPTQWTVIPIILAVLSAFGIMFAIRFGINRWKWVLVAILSIIIIAVIMYFIAVFTGKAYIWYKSFASYLPTIVYSLFAKVAMIGIIVTWKMKGAVKYISIVIFASLLIFSSYVLASTSFGKIVIPDHMQYINAGAQRTVEYLDSGQLALNDGSGLDHYEGNVKIKGTLTEAENKFDYVQFILVGSLMYLLGILVYEMRRKKSK